jgi:hypothetical protein
LVELNGNLDRIKVKKRKGLKMKWRELMEGRPKKVLIGLIIFFAVFTLFGFFGLPPIVKSLMAKKLSEAFHREVTIKQLKINPYALSITVRGFLVKERGSSDTFASFDELYVNLQSISAIKMALVLKEIRVKQPHIKINRMDEKTYNFSDLLGKKETKPVNEPAEKPKPLRFSLNNIRIENGSIDFWDEPKQTRHEVRDLNIQIPFISNIPYYIQTFVEPVLSVTINNTPYSLSGKTKVFADSHETEFAINIRDLNLPYYLAYLPVKLNFKVPSAFMDVKTNVVFIVAKDNKPSLKVMGDAVLREVAIDDEKNNPLIRLQRLDATIASAEPLLRSVHLSRMVIESPELNLVRNQSGVFNVESRFPRVEERVQAIKKGEGPPMTIDVDEMELQAGKVTFLDLSPKKPFKTILGPIGLRVDHFSNGKDKRSAYTLNLKTEANENVNVEGELSVNPLLAEGKLEVKSIPLKKYSPYYQDQILFNLEEGSLDLSTSYQYSKTDKNTTRKLSGLTLALKSLRLKKQEESEEFLNIPILTVQNTGVDLNQKTVTVEGISTQKGSILVQRLKGGELSLQSLFPESVEKEKKEEVPVQRKAEQAEKPWLLKVGKIRLDQYRVRLRDLTPEEPVTIEAEAIQFKADNLSTVKNSIGQASLSLILNKNGNISLSGAVGIDPLSADLKVSLKDVDLLPYQPYFADRVRITLEDGQLETAGNLQLKDETGKGIQIAYKGDASLNNLASIDKDNSEDFLKWKSLALSNMDVGINPFSVSIEGIALTDFYSRVIINPKGIVNLQEIMVEKKGEASKETAEKGSPKSEGNEAAPAEKESPRNIKIEKVTFQGGTINYSDNFIKPNVTVNMAEMGGRVSGLSSEEATTADVELRGKFGEQSAPVEIIGKINPLKKDLFVDLKVSFKDIELSPMSPYSGKYAGYGIEKGKLFLDLKYHIENRKLEAQNRIFLDQFTFGEKVDSPSATKLPVRLAVALLKNRKEEIDLNIPVTGSLDDPKFSIFRIILQVILNLLVKAATSPFALIGAVFGGGEQLDYMEFDYGSAEIMGENATKLDTLIKALYDRTSIKLDIEGYVDPEKDKDALTQIFFQRKLKAQRLQEILKKGQPAVPVDDIKIEPAEYEKFLKLAYKAEKFPKPKNILGMAKDIPAPEMEKLMLTYIEVKEEDLRLLASQRAMNVKEAILKSGEVEPERVFVVGPKTLTPPKREKLKDGRVEFKLK